MARKKRNQLSGNKNQVKGRTPVNSSGMPPAKGRTHEFIVSYGNLHIIRRQGLDYAEDDFKKVILLGHPNN